MGETHPGLVAGLLVNEKMFTYTGSNSLLVGVESSSGEPTKSKIVGHPQEVPSKSGQPFEWSMIVDKQVRIH